MFTYFVSLLFSFAAFTPSAGDFQVFDVGNRVQISFNGYTPGGCANEYRFVKEKEGYYRYNDHIHMMAVLSDTALTISVVEKHDSFKVYDRYANCYGYRISETEGVIKYLPDDTKNNYGVLKYSEWNEVKLIDAKKMLFDFSHYDYESNYWKPITPSIDTTTLKKWREENEWKVIVSDEDLGVYSYFNEISVAIYLNGKISYVYLRFYHRHGEC